MAGKRAFFDDDEFEIKEPVTVEATTVEEKPQPSTKKHKQEAPTAALASLAEAIEKKPTNKTCGFYLSVEAIEKLDKAAKQLKCNKSAVLDTLIKKYL